MLLLLDSEASGDWDAECSVIGQETQEESCGTCWSFTKETQSRNSFPVSGGRRKELHCIHFHQKKVSMPSLRSASSLALKTSLGNKNNNPGCCVRTIPSNSGHCTILRFFNHPQWRKRRTLVWLGANLCKPVIMSVSLTPVPQFWSLF